jgi:hypothetical protein
MNIAHIGRAKLLNTITTYNEIGISESIVDVALHHNMLRADTSIRVQILTGGWKFRSSNNHPLIKSCDVIGLVLRTLKDNTGKTTGLIPNILPDRGLDS